MPVQTSQDLHSAYRHLCKHRFTSCVMVVITAITVAGGGVVFSLVESVSRALPFERPDSLLLLWYQQKGDSSSTLTLSPVELREHRRRSELLEEIGGFEVRLSNWDEGGGTTQVVAGVVTPNLFDILGREALLGRTFVRGEGEAGRERLVVLSYNFWRQRLGGRQSVLGTTVRLDDEPHRIVGIMPSDFELFLPAIELYIPLDLDRPGLSSQVRSVLAVARLRPGKSVEPAREETQRIAERLATTYPESNREFEAKLAFLDDYFPSPVIKDMLRFLEAAALLVFLIACANVANLLLTRFAARRREVATRLAVGASRLSVFRLILMESLLLSAAGGIGGVLITLLVVDRVGSGLGPLVAFVFTPEIDLVLVAVGMGMAALAGLFFGCPTALIASQTDLVKGLKAAPELNQPGGLLPRLSLGGQIAITTVLLGGAAVMVDSFTKLSALDSRLDMDRIGVSLVSIVQAKAGEGTKQSLLRRFLEDARRIQGVRAVALASSLPRSPFSTTAPLDLPNTSPTATLPKVAWVATTPGYADVLGLNIISGRDFSSADRASTRPVALISQTAARRFWPEQNPLGQQMTLLGEAREVVGVIENLVQEFLPADSGSLPVIYLPVTQADAPGIHLLVRSTSEASVLSPSLSRSLKEISSGLTLGPISTLAQSIRQFFSGLAYISKLLAGLSTLVLFLAAFGIFGLLSYSVSLRRHEIGIRMALGAHPKQVQALFLRQGLKLCVCGVCVGTPGALLVHHLLSTVFFGVAPIRPAGLVMVIGILLITTLTATLFPARKAARLNPLQTLRDN